MNIVFASEGLGSVTPRAVWALGTFDGVHRGHVALLRAAQRQAREKGLPAGAFTFDVNPIEVLAPQRRPLYLVSLQRKLELFEEAGVGQVVVRRFEPEFAACSPQEFARAVLAEQLGAEHVVVGYDYTFGRMGQGTPVLLVQLGVELGFGVTVVPQVKVDGVPVSSTAIREAVALGDVERAARMLGRRHAVDGVVEHGRGVGAGMGIPTANLRTAKGIALPARGVYACVVRTQDGAHWPAVCNIGTRPTFSDEARGVRVEAHLVGASGDFHNQRMTVQFVQRLRPEMVFSDRAELVAQIRADIVRAVELVGSDACGAGLQLQGRMLE